MTNNEKNAVVLLATAMLVAVAAYSLGLLGPFVLDDESNLSAIPLWLSHQLELQALLFDRGAGTFGRPVSMASFAFNAWLGGYTPTSLKIGNLIIHLLCGLLIFGLAERLFRRDPGLMPRARLYATLVASIWLLHPLHASTVLYVVQRMAQLSMLVILLGLWLYVSQRERLEQGKPVGAAWGLLLGIPCMTFLAFLAKENGILLPLLCAVVELAYFRTGRRPWPARFFLIAYVIVPFVAGLALFAVKYQTIVSWYSSRDFTMAERMLSQGRALCDYLWKLLVPNPPTMGVYTDDFIASTGLLTPPGTALAILFLLALSIAAWRWRAQLPSVFFGWFFFLAAHALEASPIPLELYFEHRNYLPSVGIIVAGVALAVAAGRWLSRMELRPALIGVPMFAGILIVLAAGTHGRARVWQSELLIAESSLIAHPHSLRANAAVLSAAIARNDRTRVDQVVDNLLASPQPRHRSLGHLYRFYASCLMRGEASLDDLQAFSQETPTPLTLAETVPLRFLYAASERKRCGSVTDDQIGAALSAVADRASGQPDNTRPKIVMRYFAAQFHVRARSWDHALRPARLAWQDGAEAGIAMPLVLAQLGTRDVDGAERTWREAAERAEPGNTADQSGLVWLREQIESARAAYEAEGSRPRSP